MDKAGFRAYLAARHADEEETQRSLALAERFATHAREAYDAEPQNVSGEAAKAFARALMTTGENTFGNLLAIARFGRFVGNPEVLVAIVEILDGHEAFGNLQQAVERSAGPRARDEVFEGVDVPPLGVSNLDRARRMRTVVERLEALIGRDGAARLIGQGLRDLPADGFADHKAQYEDAGGIDEYLRRKGDRFVAELKALRDAGDLYFSQPITDAVIAYVDNHPEIRQGVRVGNVLYEAKIPYMADAYLRASDPRRKAYLSCHCPWARELLQTDEGGVPASFCACSGAFHRRPYEVIFGRPLESEVLETVLAGDPWCRFAIVLPEDVA